MTALLQVSDLAVVTTDAQATVLVEATSFTLHQGQVLTLLGESGSGKSLLAQVIMGTLPAGLSARGSIRVGAQESPAARGERRRALWGKQLALLPQEPWSALDPTMRTHAQVTETYRLVRGLSAQESVDRATRDLAQLGLAPASRQFPFQLSGGMAQRVAFAACTASGAPVLIVDEPTKGLDSDLRDQIVGLLRQVQAAGGAVLVITHDIGVPRALGGQVTVMRQSRVVETGASHDVLNAPQQAYTRALLNADPTRWPDSPRCASDTAARTVDAQPLVEGCGLTQRFGPNILFECLSLRLHPGERLAITGASGSGKTTLGNIVLGLVKPTAGSVARRKGLHPQAFQKLYQDPLAAFAPRVRLCTALQDLMNRHRLPPFILPPLLNRLGLDETLLQRLPDQVSGGELQRIALARVLLLQPALLFADEPTSRLDPISQQQTMALLTSTLAERGGAMLLVTHDATLARKVCERRVCVGSTESAEAATVAP